VWKPVEFEDIKDGDEIRWVSMFESCEKIKVHHRTKHTITCSNHIGWTLLRNYENVDFQRWDE
jgi:hypothetical protein